MSCDWIELARFPAHLFLYAEHVQETSCTCHRINERFSNRGWHLIRGSDVGDRRIVGILWVGNRLCRLCLYYPAMVAAGFSQQLCNLPSRRFRLDLMAQSDLTILVIDENAIRASIIEEGLHDAGHIHVTVIHEVYGVARTIETLRPDVIVIDIESPNRDVMEHLFQLTRTVGRPIAMFVDKSDTAQIEAAMDAGVSAYVVDGLKKERVKSILDMAVSRFNAFSRLQRELAHAKSALEERKIVERAKGILMKMRGLPEEEAFALLRQTAMNEKKKISEIAQSIVTAAGLLM